MLMVNQFPSEKHFSTEPCLRKTKWSATGRILHAATKSFEREEMRRDHRTNLYLNKKIQKKFQQKKQRGRKGKNKRVRNKLGLVDGLQANGDMFVDEEFSCKSRSRMERGPDFYKKKRIREKMAFNSLADPTSEHPFHICPYKHAECTHRMNYVYTYCQRWRESICICCAAPWIHTSCNAKGCWYRGYSEHEDKPYWVFCSIRAKKTHRRKYQRTKKLRRS